MILRCKDNKKNPITPTLSHDEMRPNASQSQKPTEKQRVRQFLKNPKENTTFPLFQ